jgi:hypothetical protein
VIAEVLDQARALGWCANGTGRHLENNSPDCLPKPALGSVA